MTFGSDLQCSNMNGPVTGFGTPWALRRWRVCATPVFVGLVLALTTCLVSAHQLKDSFLVLELTNSTLSGHLDVALTDLRHARGVDLTDGNPPDLGVLDPEFEMTSANVLSHVEFRLDGKTIPITSTEFEKASFSDGLYAVMYFEMPVPPHPHEIEIRYDLFFNVDPGYRGLLRLDVDGKQITSVFAPAHRVQRFDIGGPGSGQSLAEFFRLGVWHIWSGYDHILFLLALLFPAVIAGARAGNEQGTTFRVALLGVVKIVTAFTVAHSITLTLAALRIVSVEPRAVEALIAFSVALAALNNILGLLPELGWAIAFVFGLVHGFGFANVLFDLGLASDRLVKTLLGFNLGVEAGQLAIVCVFLPAAFRFRSSAVYRVGVLKFGSATIALVAAIWFFERLFDFKLLPF
jgi:hypothetical protein